MDMISCENDRKCALSALNQGFMGFICHKGTSCLDRGQASSRAERIWQETILFGVMSKIGKVCAHEAMTRRMHNTIDFILHRNIADMQWWSFIGAKGGHGHPSI